MSSPVPPVPPVAPSPCAVPRSTTVRAGAVPTPSRTCLPAGAVLEAVPAGGDVHLLKSIVHDWDDEASARLLRRCREAIADDGRILVVEQVMPERVVEGVAA